MGALVDDVEAYETRPGQGNLPLLRELLKKKQVQIITFTSSSTVRNFLKLLGDESKVLLKGVMLASIGPVTSAAICEEGLEVDAEAAQYTVDGLMEAILSRMKTWKRGD